MSYGWLVNNTDAVQFRKKEGLFLCDCLWTNCNVILQNKDMVAFWKRTSCSPLRKNVCKGLGTRILLARPQDLLQKSPLFHQTSWAPVQFFCQNAVFKILFLLLFLRESPISRIFCSPLFGASYFFSADRRPKQLNWVWERFTSCCVSSPKIQKASQPLASAW